ncbi:MAG TPA: hypothetical protein VF498_03715 [Anaerolineales bacterium]
MDTQWPRYQVFLQEKPGLPHQDVGSVHAPDAELALLNARDVFVRRPECASLWIVPVEAIYSRTAGELAAQAPSPDPQPANQLTNQPTNELTNPPTNQLSNQPYEVFFKPRSAGTQTWAGRVQAASPEAAMRQAVQQFSGPPRPFAWWVVPAARIAGSDPQDAASLFEPALDKPFRQPTGFRTVTAMRQIKKKPGA